MVQQNTIKSEVTCNGVGVHSGLDTVMTFKPAPTDHGIVFVRTDITDKNNIIPAQWDKVVDTRLCTVLSNEDGVRIATIEHVMAALVGCGIDNMIVEVSGEEMPIMDGSSRHFVAMIDSVGIVAQDAPKRKIRILNEITYQEGDKIARLIPSEIPTYHFEIDFANQVIGKQSHEIQLVNGNFRHEIGDARTFGLVEEVEQLKKMGLARGGSTDNAIVVDKDKILNKDGLRFNNEFVRHKILDAIGDLYLAGATIIGRYEGVKAGHAMNNKVLHALFANPDSWEWA